MRAAGSAAPEHVPIDGRWLPSWVLAFALAEVVGLGAAGGGLVGGYLAGVVGRSAAASIGLGALAGAIEGAIVGIVLGIRLRARCADLELRRWVLGTMTGAAIVWCAGMAAPFLMVHDGGAAAEPPLFARLTFEVCLGASAGMMLAAFQAPALQPLGVRPRPWLIGNGVGWAVAMPLAFVAADRPWLTVAAVTRGALLIVVMGVAVGVATGLTLWLETTRDERARAALMVRRTS